MHDAIITIDLLLPFSFNEDNDLSKSSIYEVIVNYMKFVTSSYFDKHLIIRIYFRFLSATDAMHIN